MGDERSFSRADAVFVGSLVSKTVEKNGALQSSSSPAVYRFEVSAVYKGEVSREQEVVTAAGGASCGFEMPPDTEVLVFATESGSDQFAGNSCNGTRSLENQPVPAAFGDPFQPSQASLRTAAEDDDGGLSLVGPVTVGAVGLAAVTAVIILHSRRHRSGRPSTID